MLMWDNDTFLSALVWNELRTFDLLCHLCVIEQLQAHTDNLYTINTTYSYIYMHTQSKI